MNENIVVLKARRTFINASKTIPFVLCALICVSYTEIAISLACDDFILLDGYIIPNVPFSWLIGQYFEYSYPLIFFLLVVVYATETCKWNKLGCYYTCIALVEKSYFDFEMEIWQISVVCTLNIIISAFLVYKGIKLVTK